MHLPHPVAQNVSFITCRSLSAKEPLIIGLFCGKSPMKTKVCLLFLEELSFIDENL